MSAAPKKMQQVLSPLAKKTTEPVLLHYTAKFALVRQEKLKT